MQVYSNFRKKKTSKTVSGDSHIPVLSSRLILIKLNQVDLKSLASSWKTFLHCCDSRVCVYSYASSMSIEML